MNSLYLKHPDFKKYFSFLVKGNAIAVRLETKMISEETAKTLFRELVEDLAEAIAEENP